MQKNKNLIITLAILVAIGVAGYFYATRDRSGDALLVADAPTGTAAVDNDLLSTLRQLKKLHLDGSIFSNPVWLSLTDFSKQIPSQPIQRPNPFAPLDSSLTATGGTSTPSVR